MGNNNLYFNGQVVSEGFDYSAIKAYIGLLDAEFENFNTLTKDLVQLILDNIQYEAALFCGGTADLIDSWGTSLANVSGFEEILNEWSASIEAVLSDLQRSEDEIMADINSLSSEVEAVDNAMNQAEDEARKRAAALLQANETVDAYRDENEKIGAHNVIDDFIGGIGNSIEGQNGSDSAGTNND